MTNFPKEIKFKTFLKKFEHGMCLHYIAVPDTLALKMSNKFPFRVFCRVNQSAVPAAIVKHGVDGFIIQMGKQTLKKLKLNPHSDFEVVLVEDLTSHGYEIPEEFEELLLQDDEGREAWEQLTKGAQRSYLYYLNTGKSSETRIKRSIIILQRAREIVARKSAKKDKE
jgi:hypothetical protein